MSEVRIAVLGEKGVGKSCLLETLESGLWKKKSDRTDGSTNIKYGKNNKKTKHLIFFKLEPDILNHGKGWCDEELQEILVSKKSKKEAPIGGVIYCIPCKTYRSNSTSVCAMTSINSWIDCIQTYCKNMPIVIVRTKVDMEEKQGDGDDEKTRSSSKSVGKRTSIAKSPAADLSFSREQAERLVKENEQICGYYDVSAKDGTGVKEFYSTVGSLLVENHPESCVIM